ncbi:c-type cytochrome [Rhodocyclus tenuis]|uniref:Cytochrome c553 n=1 Tax=Rhodocyclus tenuis TaxID=1066 RepID=A0A840G4V2_RHOTE|nr:c-type cytochrome [Rhodocyclus tenuis]MBB4247413.1 cytochrome c553 [Rhodocyclus tenuis]MBK1681197.1 cytochrome c4 [Rhodocyclus tenuis]
MIRTTALAVLLAASFSAFANETAKPAVDLAKAKQIAGSVCIACHGADGNSPTPAYPILAGQGADYITKQLGNFKTMVRNNPIMFGMSATLTDEDMKSLGVYFNRQEHKANASTDPALVAEGRKLWQRGDFAKGVPACSGCHGPAGAGLPAQFPRLAGQYAEYTELQLKTFRSGERANDPEKMMRTIAAKLSDDQIKAVADYVAGLH